MPNNFNYDRRNLKNSKKFPLIDSSNNKILQDRRKGDAAYLRKIELKEILLTASEFESLFNK